MSTDPSMMDDTSPMAPVTDDAAEAPEAAAEERDPEPKTPRKKSTAKKTTAKSAGRKLATRVHVGGRVWEPGEVPPADVSAQITNPRAWE